MNDEQMRPIIKAWLQARSVSPTDVPDGVARVMVRVPQAPQRGRWWPLPTPERTRHHGLTGFSALRFVTAAAIVALFGGFLLAGIFTAQQGDESVPAAVTASPAAEATSGPTEAPTTSVRTDILPGVALTVAEVEPGVFRVVDDGVRNLSPMGTDSWKQGVVAGADGNAWLVRDTWFARIGDEVQHDLPAVKSTYGARRPHDIEFAPDGTVWAITVGRADNGVGVLRSYDGERWTRRDPTQGIDVADVAVGPDGTVWVSWTRNDTKGKTFVGTVGPEGLKKVAVTDGDPGIQGFVITREGDPLLGLDQPYRGMGVMRARRYADGSWQGIAVDGSGLTALGPDGSVWMLSAQGPPSYDDEGNEYQRAAPLDTLVRFDGEERQSWRLGDGTPTFAGVYHQPGSMQVAPDGGLWLSYPFLSPDAAPSREVASDEAYFDGIVRFDGTDWQRYLRGYSVEIMDIEPDGRVWVRAGRPDERKFFPSWPDEYGVYVITPEAVAATG